MEKQYAGVLGNPEPLYFSLVLFQLSSKIRKIERDYQTIFDVMQNIGGVGEILLFVFFWVMHIHNSLLLD